MAESNKAHQVTDSERRKSELIAELARSRSGMTLHAGQAKYQADVGRRVKSSFAHHIGLWLTGALVTGGAISMLPMREKKVYINPLSKGARAKVSDVENPKKPGFWMAVAGLLMPILKPIITRFLTKRLSVYLEGAGASTGAVDGANVAAASI